MLVLSSSALIRLVLLAAPIEAIGHAPPPSCAAGTRYIELTADAPNKPTEVCIRPELSLNVLFDAKLARVDVEGRERFRWVRVMDDALMLVASETLHDGERVPVTVSFQDGAAPASATLVLVVHPSQAERQVEVSRHERTLASLRLGEQQARAEVQQCREEKARLQAECSGQGGLTGLILDGGLNEKGIIARRFNSLRPRSATPLKVQKVISYRSVGPDERERLAVEVSVFNRGTVAWTPSGAALIGAKGEELTGLKVSSLRPVPPRRPGFIVVELNAAENEVRGTFTLKLWSGEAGAVDVSLDGLMFP